MTEEKDNISFIDHLAELRKRIIWSIIPVLLASVIVFYYFEDIYEVILKSLLYKEFPTYRLFCNIYTSLGIESSFCNDIDMEPASLGMGVQFSVSIYFSIVAGILISIPWVIYQIWGFIKPGLKQKEITSVRGFGFYVLLLILGIGFGYFILAPMCVNFFGNYNPMGIKNSPDIKSYYSYIITPVLGCGILFQLPVLIYILSKLDLITPIILRKYRKHVLVVILILSAIITPPDFFSQVILAIPILLLYEISIIISGRIIKKKANI